MRRDAEVGLAKVDEARDDHGRVGCQVHQLDAVVVKQPAQEVARRDAEPALDVREANDGLAGPLCRELLSRLGLDVEPGSARYGSAR
jgi:hypothetical protein